MSPRRFLSSLIVVTALLGGGVRATGQTLPPPPAGSIPPQKSLCADCHLINSTPRSRAHLLDWQRSIHSKRGVTCEACHGGDPAAIDPMKAHLAIRGSEDPESPINRAALADTCGKCHQRSAQEFKKSRHYALLRSDPSADMPTCSTCHGAAAARLPGPEETSTQCMQCHAVGRSAGHSEYAAAAKVLMSQYDAAQTMLAETKSFIPYIDDAAQRASFEVDESRAELALASAAEASHSMNYDTVDEKLTVAFDRVIALIRRVMSAVPRAPR